VIKAISSDPRLTQLLREAGLPFEVVGPDALAALTQSGAAQPDVLTVDLRGHSAFPEALALLKRRHPATPVLLILTQLEPALMLEAMRAGVNECVIEPLALPELQAALKRLLKNQVTTQTGDVFAVVGAKG
jgi:CheY-like chemotaxis protein